MSRMLIHATLYVHGWGRGPAEESFSTLVHDCEQAKKKPFKAVNKIVTCKLGQIEMRKIINNSGREPGRKKNYEIIISYSVSTGN